MLFFRSEEHVNIWCQDRKLPRRPILNLDQLWQLACEWYANRLTEESRRPAPTEITTIFSKIGLNGPFWDPWADDWD